jgi:hypothetical protein
VRWKHARVPVAIRIAVKKSCYDMITLEFALSVSRAVRPLIGQFNPHLQRFNWPIRIVISEGISLTIEQSSPTTWENRRYFIGQFNTFEATVDSAQVVFHGDTVRNMSSHFQHRQGRMWSGSGVTGA